MSEMSHEDAMQALQAAASEDAAAEQAPAVTPAPSSPEGNAPDPVQPPQETPAAPEAPADPAENTEEFVPFNPDELPEELIPAWRQLQAAWTPKLQEAAQVRQQIEALGGYEAAQQAIELQRRLADPNQWPDIYEMLGEAMEQAGYAFEDDVPGQPSAGLPGLDLDDPDLAPIATTLQQLQAQQAQQAALLEQFQAQQQWQQQLAQQELAQAQHLAEMNRQVSAIRQTNPSYDDADIQSIIRLAPFFNDDLMQAQQAFESDVTRRMERYLSGKQAATPVSIASPAGAGLLSEQETEAESLDDAMEQAVETLRAMQAAGELDGF